MFKADCETDLINSVRCQPGLVHSRFGDLCDLHTVSIGEKGSTKLDYDEKSLAYIHLSVTGKCYARCKGCVNTSVSFGCADKKNDLRPIKDTEPERDAACIIKLLQEQVKDDAAICFYGGEPLLATDKIEHVVRIINQANLGKTIRYMVYTNGDLLKKAVEANPELMRSIWLFSVSIDGRSAQHEKIRAGTNLTKIHEGLAALKKIRTGAVLMWSTLREEQSLADCYAEFTELFEKGLADQFFWHWVETGDPFRELSRYAQQYEDDLVTIMDHYLEWLQKGKILPVTHINELVLYILSGKKRNSSACGVELAQNYDLIDGKIHSCADLPTEMAIGHIDEQGNPHIEPSDLSSLVAYKEKIGCYKCGVHNYCGGRCPVQAHISSGKRLFQYCQLMRLHVGIVNEYIERIVSAMKSQAVTAQQLYDHSAFYAQFTDVTP